MTLSGRPYVEGRVYFPRFDLEGDVSFLVDTGADASLLNPGDVVRIGVNIDLLAGSAESVGLGGANTVLRGGGLGHLHHD